LEQIRGNSFAIPSTVFINVTEYMLSNTSGAAVIKMLYFYADDMSKICRKCGQMPSPDSDESWVSLCLYDAHEE